MTDSAEEKPTDRSNKTAKCVSSTAAYNREKCKRFHHARKLRDREAHCAKQRRNSKAWRQRNRPRVAETSAKKRRANPEYYLSACKKSNRKLKTRVVEAYGGACPCGIADLAMLSVDHVGGWGAEHRRLAKGRSVYRIVVDEGFPQTYRVLCFNCNWRDEFERRRQRRVVGVQAERAREYRQRLKKATFDHYGGAICSSCKKHEGDLDVLTIDHDIPCRLGRRRKYSGWRFYELLKRQGYPAGFSVMCFNCNWVKGANRQLTQVACHGHEVVT